MQIVIYTGNPKVGYTISKNNPKQEYHPHMTQTAFAAHVAKEWGLNFSMSYINDSSHTYYKPKNSYLSESRKT